MNRIFLIGVALALLAPAMALGADQGKPLDFKFTAADGNDVDVASMRGKVVIIFYWATWSKPSRDLVKTIVNTRKKYRDQGLEVVGVSLDTDEDTMKTYADEYAMNWPEFFDVRGKDNPAIVGMHLKQIPTVWVVNKQGHVVAENPVDVDAVVARELKAK